MNLNKSTIIGIILTSGILFCFFAIYFFQKEVKRPKLPAIKAVEPFQLTDAEGKTFDSSELKGRVWVADFFFTTCADVCPMMTKHMADLSRTFEMIKGVHFVSITVNPETDTPTKLQEYAKNVKSNNKQWHFLTGDRREISRIMLENFKLGSKDEPIFHSTYFALVDRNGYVRGYYDGTDKDRISQLFKDISLLLKEH
jgi:protein SCO1/2